MLVVALEEHFTVPELVRQIPPDRIRECGFPSPDAPWGSQSHVQMLGEPGAPRLRDMGEAGISLQLLSVPGLGADLVPPAEDPALARVLNDTLACDTGDHPGRYAGLAHLALITPEAAAVQPEQGWARFPGQSACLAHGPREDRIRQCGSACGAEKLREERPSFLKKRSKKLLLLTLLQRLHSSSQRATAESKVFCFFSSKKKAFLPSFRSANRCA